MTEDERARIIATLDKWIRQRPGLEFGNYGDFRAYRAELRHIGQQLADARTLLRAVELSSMTADTLKAGFRAYSGRLEWTGKGLTYCTGQYWPTEYRAAACAVLASALWQHEREGNPGMHTGDTLRASFRRRFGRGIASRWFS